MHKNGVPLRRYLQAMSFVAVLSPLDLLEESDAG